MYKYKLKYQVLARFHGTFQTSDSRLLKSNRNSKSEHLQEENYIPEQFTSSKIMCYI